MSLLLVKLMYISMMKCTFMTDNLEQIRECQDKVFHEYIDDKKKKKR